MYEIKELTKEDLRACGGLFETLENLTQVDYLDLETSEKLLDKIHTQDGHVFVAIIEHEIIGATTILIEQKFIRGGKKCGHIEDVVTRKEYQGQGIAGALINRAIDYARQEGCYKIILDCEERIKGFYEKFGFVEKEKQMRLDTSK